MANRLDVVKLLPIENVPSLKFLVQKTTSPLPKSLMFVDVDAMALCYFDGQSAISILDAASTHPTIRKRVPAFVKMPASRPRLSQNVNVSRRPINIHKVKKNGMYFMVV
jgi:hypothetical protein